ncbi:MAG TPA: lipopolysaccharide kinase InaA family protein [Phycisphaerales bacterium]|jgi:hypothetical protein|nr:lipopolysaccharide kinase InaA family protein [Phycisphaerales bacterium]
MQRMSQAEFQALTAGAATLSADEHGPKVLQTPGGRVIKLFRRKRLLSSTLLVPYARRFERASQRLAALDIPAARVERVARVPSIHRDIVIYPHVPGISLREALAGADDKQSLLRALAQLFVRLHERGVYFRAAHFGNFLVQPSEEPAVRLALVDLSEARFRRGELAPAMRARNFKPMTRYREDLDAVRSFGADRFITAYLDSARLDAANAQRFREALGNIDEAFNFASAN